MKRSKIKIHEVKNSPLEIMRRLGQLIEESKDLSDSEFYYDRLYFMKRNFETDRDTYKSTDQNDKDTVLEYDLETLSVLINQVIRFSRILMSTDEGTVYNFPKNSIPKFEINDVFNTNKHNTIQTNMEK
tara:strand:+ start:1319 stop:1705 length:387 start_codon:yes stop_codon:yes gene_type:complete